jgi:uncharacterized protein (DUF934 family)
MKFLASQDALLAQAVHLSNDTDVLASADELRGATTLALHFPKWTDGRAYSQAVLLRGRVRFTGRLVATGDVVADMAPMLRRCGFDAAQLRAGQRVETAQRALGFFDMHYQNTLAERREAA